MRGGVFNVIITQNITEFVGNLKDLVFVMEIKDGEMYYAYANNMALKWIGEHQSIVGKTLYDVLKKEQADKLLKRYQEVINRREHIVYQDTIQLEKGVITHGESVLSPSFDAEGNVVAIVSITRDITKQQLEKKSLLHDQLWYKALFENNIDGILTLDVNGVIIDANIAMEGILDYPKSELQHTSILDLIHVKNIKEFYAVISPTLLGKATQSEKCQLSHRNGYYIDVYLKTVPIVVNNVVEGMYVIVRDITSQTESEKKIHFLANHDALTGLLNRVSFSNNINQSMIRYQMSTVEFAVLIVDIDRFKVVNDVLGSQLGDYVIEEFANRLKTISTKGISIYRIGGDEFAILIEPCSQRKATQVSNEVLAKFRPPVKLNDHEYYMSCTIGIGMYPTDGSDAEELIKNATIALHRGKENGRGNYQFYNSNLHYLSPRTIGLETNLRRSIDYNELVLYYQPQFNMERNELCGMEALVRWDSHQYGLVSPLEFIPIAEETGFILEIGEWVIYEVCAQLRRWIDNGHIVVPVGINLSPKQFLSPVIFDTVQDALLRNKIHPSLITIEITENAMMDPKRTIDILKRLKEIGVRISVDDFGTGYSSLSYLKKFPLDMLKIDRSFIDEISTDGADAVITTSLIQLAHLLGISVIAEGVETEAQIDFLKSRNCIFAQGYYYGKPTPSKIFESQFLSRT